MTTEQSPFDKKEVKMASVPIGLLNIDQYNPDTDTGYQRTAYAWRVKRIASQWDDMRAGVLKVSERVGGPDAGKLFVVDGQHRLEAARIAFADDEDYEIMCAIAPMTYEEEAAFFASQFQDTQRVAKRSMFHARLQAKDPDALAVQDIVHKTGWKLSTRNSPTSHNSIVAVSALDDIYKNFGPTILTETLLILANAYGYRYEAVDNRMISGLAHFLWNYSPRYVNRHDLATRLGRPGNIPKFIMQEAARYGGFGSGKAGASSVSRALLDVYNKGRQAHTRLEWDTKKYRDEESR